MKKKKIVYKTWGLIGEKTLLRRFQYKGRDFNHLSYDINIGQFCFGKNENQKYTLFLFIFDPCNKATPNSPFYSKGSINISNTDKSYLSSSTTGLTITEYNIYYPIIYLGNGLKIKKIYWNNNMTQSPIPEFDKQLKDIFTKIESKIRKVKTHLEY